MKWYTVMILNCHRDPLSSVPLGLRPALYAVPTS
jgi:hypothetical protein